MTVNVTKLIFSSSNNTFKNTGVYDTSIVLSGTILAGQTRTFTSVVVLDEVPTFVFAKAKYREFTKYINGFTSQVWQKFPTHYAYIPTTPTGNLGADLRVNVNGTTVTFTAVIHNPYGATETITAETIRIRYSPYTLTN
jgi:hypothetical protein